jgi:hypothetical protein
MLIIRGGAAGMALVAAMIVNVASADRETERPRGIVAR